MKRVTNSPARGIVYLIGAGPGDPELLTLKAVRALQSADVVLLDELVDRRVLQFASHARLIKVGKRGGCRSTPQAFIERLLVRLARQGQVVARLKGGDPFVFGRGGEETLALARAGVPFEVVPGITAGIAVPATLGIPITHRGMARGVTFVTGHTRDGDEPNWKALAEGGTTLVIYMGMQRAGAITHALLAAGMPANTPAAAIAHGTRPGQREVVTTLVALAGAIAQADLDSPALIVLGKVVGFAQEQLHACRSAA
jgi:uroporphyrin-III C-methyltransferase